jgi:hypothetical protein
MEQNPFVQKRPCYWWDNKPRRGDMPPPDHPTEVEDWLTAWLSRDRSADAVVEPIVGTKPSDEPKSDPQ